MDAQRLLAKAAAREVSASSLSPRIGSGGERTLASAKGTTASYKPFVIPNRGYNGGKKQPKSDMEDEQRPSFKAVFEI